jgi:hypothetical protein
MRVAETPRNLTPDEIQVLQRLIELAPADQQEALRLNLGRARAGVPCACGCGGFQILVDGESKTEQDWLVAEGFVDRGDRQPLGVLLFASNDRPTYLEFYDSQRQDDDPPIPLPTPADITA